MGSAINDGVTGVGNFSMQCLPYSPTALLPHLHVTVEKMEFQRSQVRKSGGGKT